MVARLKPRLCSESQRGRPAPQGRRTAASCRSRASWSNPKQPPQHETARLLSTVAGQLKREAACRLPPAVARAATAAARSHLAVARLRGSDAQSEALHSPVGGALGERCQEKNTGAQCGCRRTRSALARQRWRRRLAAERGRTGQRRGLGAGQCRSALTARTSALPRQAYRGESEDDCSTYKFKGGVVRGGLGEQGVERTLIFCVGLRRNKLA